MINKGGCIDFRLRQRRIIKYHEASCPDTLCAKKVMIQMDRIQAMQIFVRVVEARSFTRAAESLSMPASSVTQTIKQLEAYLGTRLLQRTTRSVNITDDGTRYYNECRRILDDIVNVEASFGGSVVTPKGRLRVDAVASLARMFIIPRLLEFRRQFPDIHLTLGLSDRPVDLVQEGVDCVIRAGALVNSATLTARKIGEFRWVTCASPSYVTEAGTPRTIDDLSCHRLVGYMSSRTGRPIDWHFGSGEESVAIKTSPELIVNDTESYVDCGLQGLGIIRISEYLARPHIAAGTLIQLLEDSRGPTAPISIAYAAGRHQPPALRSFVSWVTDAFASHPWLRDGL